MTFDFDLSSTDLNINRDDLHLQDNLLIKFEGSGAKLSVLELSVAQC